jgi:hypothetical protein
MPGSRDCNTRYSGRSVDWDEERRQLLPDRHVERSEAGRPPAGVGRGCAAAVAKGSWQRAAGRVPC